jgi:hypothetical protein
MTVDPSAAVVESKEARVGGVRRMVSGEDAAQETEQPIGVETRSGETPPQEPIKSMPPRRPMNFEPSSSAFPPWHR